MAMVVPRSGRGAAHVSFVVQNAVKGLPLGPPWLLITMFQHVFLAGS